MRKRPIPRSMFSEIENVFRGKALLSSQPLTRQMEPPPFLLLRRTPWRWSKTDLACFLSGTQKGGFVCLVSYWLVSGCLAKRPPQKKHISRNWTKTRGRVLLACQRLTRQTEPAPRLPSQRLIGQTERPRLLSQRLTSQQNPCLLRNIFQKLKNDLGLKLKMDLGGGFFRLVSRWLGRLRPPVCLVSGWLGNSTRIIFTLNSGLIFEDLAPILAFKYTRFRLILDLLLQRWASEAPKTLLLGPCHPFKSDLGFILRQLASQDAHERLWGSPSTNEFGVHFGSNWHCMSTQLQCTA